MAKIVAKPRTLLVPLPAVMVSCSIEGEKPNIITISWIGIVNSEPPMLSISIALNRHSHRIVRESGEFVVNLTSEDNLRETDFCGTYSGRKHDKFAELNLTPVVGQKVKGPLIGECPINLECVVRQSHVLGSHEMFVGEIVATHVEENLLENDGRLNIDKLKPLIYCPVAREYRGKTKPVLSRPDKSSSLGKEK